MGGIPPLAEMGGTNGEDEFEMGEVESFCTLCIMAFVLYIRYDSISFCVILDWVAVQSTIFYYRRWEILIEDDNWCKKASVKIKCLS